MFLLVLIIFGVPVFRCSDVRGVRCSDVRGVRCSDVPVLLILADAVVSKSSSIATSTML